MQFSKTLLVFLVIQAAIWKCPIVGFCDVAGGILVFASDSSSTTQPPPSTTAILNETESLIYGTNDLVTFSGYFEEGTHTVEVVTASSGYLPRQSPTDPDALNDPDSIYGNPRRVTITESSSFTAAGFQFDPVITATAVVRDIWTMERLENVTIEFVFESSTGDIAICKYPETANYASNWLSNASGDFPDNTILYLDDYDLHLTKTGYQPYSSNNIIANASPGDHFDLGTIFMVPIDTNTNLISDAWEMQYYGTACDGSGDSDNDGMCNRDEYLAGTDPTNWDSCLWIFQTLETNGNILFQWETEADRTYRVCGTTNLCSSNAWTQVAGSWEAADGQQSMAWSETNHHLSWCNSYRVEVMPCNWTGTNAILIRTNDWPTSSSGGSTNNWPTSTSNNWPLLFPLLPL